MIGIILFWYRKLSIDERCDVYMEVLNKLATEGGGDFDYPLIIGDSIIRYEDDECIYFQYNDGRWASVELEDWVIDYGLFIN